MRPRILFACNSYPPAIGGAEKVCKDMVDFLSKKYNVTVITRPVPGRKDKQVCEFETVGSYSVMTELKEYLNKHKFDLYISFGFGKHFSDVIGRWCRKNKKPFIFMPCGRFHTISRTSLSKKIYLRFLGSPTFLSATKIITATQWEKDFWVKQYKLNSDKIIVIPYNLDPKFSKYKPTKILQRNKLKKKQYLLYIGRADKNKLTKLLLNDYKHTSQKMPLVLAGRGTDECKYEVRFGDTTNIVFLGQISENDKKTLIAGAKLCIFPTSYESFGMVLLECMALKTPTIGSNIGPFRELLNHSLLLFNNIEGELQYYIERVFTKDYPLLKIKLPNQHKLLNKMVEELL